MIGPYRMFALGIGSYGCYMNIHATELPSNFLTRRLQTLQEEAGREARNRAKMQREKFKREEAADMQRVVDFFNQHLDPAAEVPLPAAQDA